MSRKHILADAVLLLALSLGVYFLFFRHIEQPDIVVLKSSRGERQVMQALRGSVTRYQINVPLPAGATISWRMATVDAIKSGSTDASTCRLFEKPALLLERLSSQHTIRLIHLARI